MGKERPPCNVLRPTSESLLKPEGVHVSESSSTESAQPTFHERCPALAPGSTSSLVVGNGKFQLSMDVILSVKLRARVIQRKLRFDEESIEN